jgi:dihydroorotate dehydrogenase (fumarate)
MLSTRTGKITIYSPIYNASGVGCLTHEELKQLDTNLYSGAALSKSTTFSPCEGNLKPRYWDDNKTRSINSSGLPNRGHAYYLNTDFIESLIRPYIVSISGKSFEDNMSMIDLASKSKISGIELNLSCPNIIGKSQIGYDYEAMEKLVSKSRNIIPSYSNINFGVKLPPYFDFIQHETVAGILNRCNIDTITCINSLGNGLVIDPEKERTVILPKGGFGGIGGQIIKPIALANVRRFSQLTSCDVIGCGGITSGMDAFEHILCGARAVQIGTQFHMEGIDAFKRIYRELAAIMVKKQYTSIDDFCGKLKTI